MAGFVYFGSYTVWGERGVIAFEDIQAKLDVLQLQLSSLRSQRNLLEHRTALLEREDTDLVEEIARTKLMDGAPHQVAIPRSSK